MSDLVDLNDVEVRSDDRVEYEKFNLDKLDKARILLPSTQIAQKFVHVFHTEGPEMVERNGKLRPDWSRESFAGSFICTGKSDVVAKNPRYGDPDNCAACKAMHNTEEQLIEPPKKTYAMNVIKYSTKPKDNLKLRNKNVEVQVWRHQDDKKIAPIKTAAAQLKENKKSIDSVDFLIAADNTEWKKYEISPSLDGAWHKKDKELAENVAAAREELHDADTLNRACGRSLSQEELEAEVTMLIQQYNRNSGKSSSASRNGKASSNNDTGVSLDDSEDLDFSQLEDVDVEGFASILDED